VVPLVVASGAGAASRISLGTAVLGGMLIATASGVFMIPVFYVIIQGLVERKGVKKADKITQPAPAESV